jgi:hypothetical protein
MSIEELKERGWRQFQGNAPLKVDIPRYVEADPDIINLSLKIEYYSSMAKFLEDVVRSINFRRGIITDMITMMRFQSGVG